jgi:hypothetical protein
MVIISHITIVDGFIVIVFFCTVYLILKNEEECLEIKYATNIGQINTMI